jgi:hypothetical protein
VQPITAIGSNLIKMHGQNKFQAHEPFEKKRRIQFNKLYRQAKIFLTIHTVLQLIIGRQHETEENHEKQHGSIAEDTSCFRKREANNH